MKHQGVLYLLLLLVLMSCSDGPEFVKQAEPIELTAFQTERVMLDNEFALNLFKKTISANTASNVFISPLSISMSLGMLWNGANNETKSEIEHLLGVSELSVDEVNEYYRLMQNSLLKIDPTTKLSIANSLWYRNTFQVKPKFLKTNSDYFFAKVAALDFSSPTAVTTINNWCSEKTNQLIPKVIDRIEPTAMMFLINAIYFKGNWVKKFDKRKTTEELFTTDKSEQVKVNMMRIDEKFKYVSSKTAEFLEMPYGNKAFSMLIILPIHSSSTEDVLNDLTSESLKQTLAKMSSPKVSVRLPRFQVQQNYQLKPVLQSMGMQQAFTKDADLTGISDLKPLFVESVQHDTFVKVDEEGTEAAAVTKTSIFTKSDEGSIPFIADRPFLFLIRENSTGIILFIGKMGDVKKF